MSTQNQFIVAVNNNRNLIYQIINSYCYDESDKDDLYQDILLRAWQSFHTFKGDSKISTWLGRVARNVSVDRLRKLKTRISTTALNNFLYEWSDSEYHEPQIPPLDKLTARERQTLEYRMEGKSFQEISVLMDEPVNRLLVRMHRIKKQLAEYCKNYE